MGIKTFADYEESEGAEGATTYAGGEKSGLALDQGPPRTAHERMELYANGFRMLGRFRPFSDPANKTLWEQIRRGEAPQELRDKMSQYPEGLTVEVVDKSSREFTDEGTAAAASVAPESRRFAGQGYTLSATATAPVAARPVAKPKAPKVDASQPTVRLTFRLFNGQRLTQDFNLTHSVADVYSFVAAVSSNSSPAAPFKLVAGFPPAKIDDAAPLSELQNELLIQQPL